MSKFENKSKGKVQKVEKEKIEIFYSFFHDSRSFHFTNILWVGFSHESVLHSFYALIVCVLNFWQKEIDKDLLIKCWLQRSWFACFSLCLSLTVFFFFLSLSVSLSIWKSLYLYLSVFLSFSFSVCLFLSVFHYLSFSLCICLFLFVIHCLSSLFYTSGSQPFFARGTLNMRKNFGAHLYLNFFEKDLGKELYFTNCKQNLLIFLKRVVKVRSKKNWRHTWKELTAH